MPETQTRKIDVAVIGGGIGGLCVTIGLLQNPNVRVQIYEAAHKFSEIGAGIAFGPNAQRALRLISPATEQAYLRQATHHQPLQLKKTWFEFRFGTVARDGELAAAPHNETGQVSLHRAKFLDELISLIPEEIAHFGKRLARIEDRGLGKGVQMHFQDGTVASADCVIGADGIHSAVREYLLGPKHPSLHPVFTGCVGYRRLVPMDEACAALGDRYTQASTIWLGDGRTITTYPIDHGKTLNIAAVNSLYEKWEGPWVQPADSKKLKQDFAGLGENVQKIVKLLDIPTTQAWSMWDLPSAPGYWSGNVVMMGDAAHASTPFQGQGAGQAIEDAYVLESLFEMVKDTAEIPHAFRAFDKIRRPRCQRVVTTSRETNEICCLRFPGIGDDAAALKENIEWRMDWMWHRDIMGERNEAVTCFEELLAGRSID